MRRMMYTIKHYEQHMEKTWDEFVNTMSVNGNFLHTRNFLNYHPEGRFKDASLVVYDEKEKLAAVVPACEVEEDGKRVFFSHKGSTFGGIVISNKHYNCEHVISMIQELQKYIQKEGYDKAYLKNTSEVFSMQNVDLFEFAFPFCGWKEYKELNTYIEYSCYRENILSNFSKGKKRNVDCCEKEGYIVRELESDLEIEQFYGILCENLEKYHVKPVHTVEELLEFKHSRLSKESGFFGCFLGEKMIAGSMMFYFNRCLTAHTQYLAAKEEYQKTSPMTYIYYSMIKTMRERGFRKISFGIATEELGTVINYGLLDNKERYGSQYSNNCTYYMDFTKEEA